VLLTAFNRRFSPYAARISELLRERSGPTMLTYRMNAGHLPADHWVHGLEGGSRNLGEACHIYDLFTFLTGARTRRVTAQSIRPTSGHDGRNDNFVATIEFEDGSVATLTYTALGSADHPKEQLEVFVDGKVIALDDYRRLTLAGSRANGLTTQTADKGHKEELRALGRALREGGAWPIPLWQQVQATEIALDVEAQITGA
jgi:predicted dehydrogenase